MKQRPLAMGVLALAAGALLWTAGSVSALGVPFWRYLVALKILGLVCWAFGGVVQLWLGIAEAERREPIPRLAIGFAALTALLPLLLATRMGLRAALALVAGLGVTALVAARSRVRPRPPDLPRSVAWLTVALLLRAFSAGSAYVRVDGATARLIQHWDLTLHLGYVKEALFRGLPVAQHPTLAAVPRPSYHPAFTEFAASLIRASGLPVDAGFFGVVLPLLGVAFACALMTLGAYATGSRRGQYAPLAVLAGFLLASGSANAGTDWLGFSRIAYFMHNPPASLAAVGGCVSIALLARGSAREHGLKARRALIVAGVLAAATLSMKANVAIALIPAFGTATLLAGARARSLSDSWQGLTAAAVATVAYALVIRGSTTPMWVDFGAYARFARTNPPEPVTRAVARVTSSAGLAGDAAYLLAFVLLVMGSWRLAPAIAALVRRRMRTPVARDPATSAGSAYLGAYVLWAVLIGFTVVQVDVGRFSAWNIAGHTVSGVVWVGVALGSSGLAVLSRTALRRLPATSRWLALALVLVALTPLAMHSVSRMRQVGHAEVPVRLLTLLRRIPSVTPADAAVAQHFETERDAWVAGIGGRPAVLERAETWRAYQPAVTQRRESALRDLYSARDPAAALSAARALRARYAVIGPRDPAAIALAGRIVARSGEWALVRFGE